MSSSMPSSQTVATSSALTRMGGRDLAFTALCVLGAAVAQYRYHTAMDGYEQFFLWLSAASLALLGGRWRALQGFSMSVAGLSLLGIALYGDDLARGERAFWLKYVLASQSAIMWMSFLFGMATLAYWLALWRRSAFVGKTASGLTWVATILGFTGLMVRWYESYLIGPDVGHIPVSNLYEVFVLFCLLTALMYLYYEMVYQTRQMGGFVLLVIAAAVAFLLWYAFERQAHQIQPLIPALQSYWMKIHVPANFVGYGTFSIAAMVGFAYLVKFVGTPFSELPPAFQSAYGALPKAGEADAPGAEQALATATARHARRTRWLTIALWVLGALLFIEPLVFRKGVTAEYISTYWALYFGTGLAAVGFILLGRKALAKRLPDFAVLDDIMYKAIAIGFVFFTIATILGALWAADAWGKYWSWDPKETWALIVWLNYAAWLHLRLMAGMRGTRSALWALVGLLITGFAFLGVNIFLSGLHSYGTL